MKVFIQSIVAQLLLNPYIYWRGHQALPRQKKWQVTYFLLFLFEICLYLFGFFFRKDLPDSVFIPIMNICNTWYIGSIYITLGLLCLEVIRISQRKWKWLPGIIAKHWEKSKRILFALFLALRQDPGGQFGHISAEWKEKQGGNDVERGVHVGDLSHRI